MAECVAQRLATERWLGDGHASPKVASSLSVQVLIGCTASRPSSCSMANGDDDPSARWRARGSSTIRSRLAAAAFPYEQHYGRARITNTGGLCQPAQLVANLARMRTDLSVNAAKLKFLL